LGGCRGFYHRHPERLQRFVWMDGCNIWYKNGQRGSKVVGPRPGSSLHYFGALSCPKVEDRSYSHCELEGGLKHSTARLRHVGMPWKCIYVQRTVSFLQVLAHQILKYSVHCLGKNMSIREHRNAHAKVAWNRNQDLLHEVDSCGQGSEPQLAVAGSRGNERTPSGEAPLLGAACTTTIFYFGRLSSWLVSKEPWLFCVP